MLLFKKQEAGNKSRNSVGQCPKSISNPTTEVGTEATSMIPGSGYS